MGSQCTHARAFDTTAEQIRSLEKGETSGEREGRIEKNEENFARESGAPAGV